MELLLISDSKLKIMLDGEDMRKYRLDAEKADYDNTQTRRVLWEILDEAKNRTGFDAASDKVLIQLYPSRDGGCELFVTKLGLLPPLTEKTIARSANVTLLTSRVAVYRFALLSELCEIARELSEAGSVRKSDVYLGEDGGYYLIMEERGGKNSKLTEFSYLCEWAQPMPSAVAAYQREHGVCLCEGDAVGQFAAL